jgi:hypothetical protein
MPSLSRSLAPNFSRSYFHPLFFALVLNAPSFLRTHLRASSFLSCSWKTGGIGRTGQVEQDGQNMTDRTGQAEQDRQNRTGRTGQAE